MPDSITAPVTIIRNEITAPITLAGRDAYQLAVADGFVGTREEWLASLKGDDGAAGQTGPPGTTSWNGITDKPSTFTPSAHKSTHATGGSDAIAPSDIGAAASSHTHPSSDISDATATPTVGKVALWSAAADYTAPMTLSGLTGALSAANGSCAYGGASYWHRSYVDTGELVTVDIRVDSGHWVITIVDNGYRFSYKWTGSFSGSIQAGPELVTTWVESDEGYGLSGQTPHVAAVTLPAIDGTAIANATHQTGSKTTPVDADEFGFWNSATSAWAKVSWTNIKATLKTYFDTLYTLTNLGGTPTTRTIGNADLSANRTLADIGAAMASTSQTASFTAVKSGRYHVAGSATADGSVVVTDPSSPAPVAHDIYKVVIDYGYVRIGGVDYFKSRHEITRHYTGSAWETLSPYYSEAPDYAAGIKSAARANLGAGAVGDTLFTAASVAAAQSVLGEVTLVSPSDVSRNLTTTYAQDDYIKNFSLVAGKKYQVTFHLYVIATSNGGFRARFYITNKTFPTGAQVIGCLVPPGGTPTYIEYVSASGYVGQSTISRSGVTADGSSFSGWFEFVADSNGNLELQWAQNASHADNTTRKANSSVTVKCLNP